MKRERIAEIAELLDKRGKLTLEQLEEHFPHVSQMTLRRDLARLEGIMCGISSGTNVAAAKRLAKILGKGKTVVTVLPDTAERYFSTPLFEK